MSLFKRSATVLTLNWLFLPLGFITSILVAREIGPEGKGVQLLLAGLLGVLVSLFNLGLPTAAAFYYKKEYYRIDQIIAVCLLIALSVLSVLVILFFFLYDDFLRIFLGDTQTIVVQPVWIWLTLAILFPSLILPISDVLLIVDGDMKLYTVKNLGAGLSGLLLTWLFVLIYSWGITGLLLSQLLASLIPITVLVRWLYKKGVTIRKINLSKRLIRDMINVGGQQYGLSLVAMVSKRVDAFMITGLLSIQEAGYYSLAYTLYDQMANIPRATVWPLVSKLTEKENKEETYQIAFMSRTMLALMFLITLTVGLTAPLLIRLLYGESFLPAVYPIWGILPSVVAAPIISIGNSYFMSRGQPGKLILPAVVGTFAQVVTSLVLITRIGIVGNALGFSTSQVIIAMFILRELHKQRIKLTSLLFISTTDISKILSFGWDRIRNRLIMSSSKLKGYRF